MSMFHDPRYFWRETYLVMLDFKHRPASAETVRRLQTPGSRLEIRDVCSDTNGLLDSLIVLAPDDSAAVEIQYREGDDVAVEFAALADELERHELTAKERNKIARARGFSAKIELQHFEQMQDASETKRSIPTQLSFPRYSSFVKNLTREMSANDEPDEFDLAERLDPNTLIRILKLVTHLANGVAFDPAGGVVL